MDLNRFPIPTNPLRVEVYFVCRSKTEFREVYIQERGEQAYQEFLRSPRPFVVPRIIRSRLWYCIYI